MRVTPVGRVVVIDFGVATEFAPTSGEAPNDPCETAGTTRYMAPELSRGGPPTAASDWYSVGVIIHQILLDGLDGAQPELDALRDDILRRDPSLRPGGDEIARRIGGPVDPPPVTAEGGTDPDAGAPFVGREASLAILRRAFEDVQRGGSIAVRVSGPSGMGKSTLVRTFLDGLGDGEALILRGRAYERESVPYKAMDSVVDALSRRLMRLDLRPLPAGADALARLFPRAPAGARAPGSDGTAFRSAASRPRVAPSLRSASCCGRLRPSRPSSCPSMMRTGATRTAPRSSSR